jgi:anaerobic magnesium-protoporphyrin IX monomethyl ester cyclase
VAAVLRQNGWRVAVFDAMLAPDESAFESAMAQHRPRLVILCEDNFNFLSKMCLARMRAAALAMTRHAVAAGVPVLAGGSDATDDPAAFLAAGATAVILGEPERTAEAAVAILLRGNGPGALGDVAGLALPQPAAAGGLRRTLPREPLRRPDELPLPARDLVDMAAYRSVWEAAHGYFSTNLVSTRGCPFHCNWCAKPIWGQRYAMRHPAAVADELALVKRELNPDHVWFADDIFGLRPDWTAAFGREVAERDAAIPFQIQSRVDLISPLAADGLAQAGCAEVWLGVESGSQRVLDAMDKGIQVADVPAVVDRLHAHGVRVGFFLQLGYPGEEWPDIEATAELVRTLLPDEIGVSVSYPLPGTLFYDRVATDLGARRHWQDSQDLAMLFTGHYETAFYRALRDLLHRELAARQALALARRSGAGTATASAALHEVMQDWAALSVSEAEQRSAWPTVIPPGQRAGAVPDLSLTAN